MKVEFRKGFEKDLRNILDESLLQRIGAVIQEVECAENLAEVSNIKKLKGEGNYYRLRVGDYRIGVVITENAMIFVRVLHRKDIYKFFP